MDVLDSSLIGMKRQKTAMEEPITAIQTTETADGTRTKKSPKCIDASKKPKAELCKEHTTEKHSDAVNSMLYTSSTVVS
mgnify:CR=1 FL=1